MWIVDGTQTEHRCLATFTLGMTSPQHDSVRTVNCYVTIIWSSSQNVLPLMHVTTCGVECLILDVGTIFDNTFDVFVHCGMFHRILME